MKKTKSEKDNRVKYGTVSLPIPLINIIKDKIKGTGMGSVSSYVSFVLRQILSAEGPETELKSIQKGLKKLGYL